MRPTHLHPSARLIWRSSVLTVLLLWLCFMPKWIHVTYYWWKCVNVCVSVDILGVFWRQSWGIFSRGTMRFAHPCTFRRLLRLSACTLVLGPKKNFPPRLSVEMITGSVCSDWVQPSVLIVLHTVFSHHVSGGCRILNIFIMGATSNTASHLKALATQNYTPTLSRCVPSLWTKDVTFTMLVQLRVQLVP